MAEEPVGIMNEFISLDYATKATDEGMRFLDKLIEGKIIGHKSKVSGMVYVPPKGFCPLTGTPTSEEDEVEVSDHGTATAFTIIDPIQYYGQKETQRYVQAQVLLDGASSALWGCRIDGIDPDEMRAGLRVRARWKSQAERANVADSWAGRAITACIESWEPSGEPDVDAASIADHVF